MLRFTGKVVFAAVVVLALRGLAGAETLDEIIAAVDKRGESVKDMACTMTMDMKVMGMPISMSGPWKMMKPKMFSMDMTMTMSAMGKEAQTKMKMVCDGETMYQVVETPGGSMVNKVDMAALGLSSPNVPGMGTGAGGMMDPSRSAEGLKNLTDVKVLPDETLGDGQKAWVVEGMFKPEYYQALQGKGAGASAEVMKSQMAGMRVHVGQKDRFINKVTFLSSERKETGTVTFEDVRFNLGLKAEEFKYKPADGVAVNDITEMVRKQMQGAKPEGEGEAGTAKTAPADAPPSAVLKTGVPAPAFVVKTFDGGEIELTKLRGKRVLIYFWANWHKRSTAMLADVAELAKTWKDREFDVVALSLDERASADAVKKTVGGKDLAARSAFASDEILDAYWVSKVPTYVLVDADGKVVSSESEPKDLAELKKTLETAAKPQAAKAAE